MLTLGRRLALDALEPACAAFPDLDAAPLRARPEGGQPRELTYAQALLAVVLRRWLTLEHVLHAVAEARIATLPPRARAVLLIGTAELLFLDGTADHAAVSQAVEAMKEVAPKRMGFTNAVLRRVAEAVAGVEERPWSPSADAVPHGRGLLRFKRPLFPPPSRVVRHLAAATSHPRPLLRGWLDATDPHTLARRALAGVRSPSMFVADEHHRFGLLAQDLTLTQWLAGDPRRRVQDPAAAAGIEHAARTPAAAATSVLDLCAGRGTKTRHLAARFPHAQIDAYEPDPDRRADLAEAAAALREAGHRVRVVDDAVLDRGRATYGLVLADVPCSNTAVLGRRPEARYRFSEKSVSAVVRLQSDILERAAGLIRPGGWCLYQTCSLEPAENDDRARGLADRLGDPDFASRRVEPGVEEVPDVTSSGECADGTGGLWHDGSYHALLRARA